MKITSNADPFLGIMSGRLDDIIVAKNTLDSTGIPLLGHNSSRGYYLIDSDDPGIYYFIPKFAALFNLSVNTSYKLVFLAAIILGFIIGSIGLYKLLSKTAYLSYAMAILGVFVLWNIVRSDVYIYYFLACSSIPLMYSITSSENISWKKIMVFFLLLIILSISNIFRSQSGNIVYVFTCIILVFQQKLWKHRLVYGSMIIFSIIATSFYVKSIVQHRNNLIVERNIAIKLDQNAKHPIWHSIYIGLGYIPNKQGITYDDSCAIKKVYSVKNDVVFCGAEYEQILQNAYLEVLRNDPIFFLSSYLVKGGITLVFILILSIPLFLLKHKKILFSEWIIYDVPVLFSAVSAVLVVPRLNYMTPIIYCCFFISLVLLKPNKTI